MESRVCAGEVKYWSEAGLAGQARSYISNSRGEVKVRKQHIQQPNNTAGVACEKQLIRNLIASAKRLIWSVCVTKQQYGQKKKQIVISTNI